jgi:hypothetical protein
MLDEPFAHSRMLVGAIVVDDPWIVFRCDWQPICAPSCWLLSILHAYFREADTAAASSAAAAKGRYIQPQPVGAGSKPRVRDEKSKTNPAF